MPRLYERRVYLILAALGPEAEAVRYPDMTRRMDTLARKMGASDALEFFGPQSIGAMRSALMDDGLIEQHQDQFNLTQKGCERLMDMARTNVEAIFGDSQSISPEARQLRKRIVARLEQRD